MLLALDLHYRKNLAKAVGVLFNCYNNKPEKIFIEYIDTVNDYIPGEFYKRELPCIKAILDKVDLNILSPC